MGTWGTALFSDDTARDVRDRYRELVGDGLSGPLATSSLLGEWRQSLEDADVAPVFWLSLAATQWQCGRLEERVKQRAIEVIDSGVDPMRWSDEPKLSIKRQAVLDELKFQLLSPQPAEKRIPKFFRNTCDWSVGEVITYRMASGLLLLFRVIGSHNDRGGTSPVCELLDWMGHESPGLDAIRRLSVRTSGSLPGPVFSQFMLGRTSEREYPETRVRRLGVRLPPAQKPGGYLVFLWRNLDRQLEEIFGIA